MEGGAGEGWGGLVGGLRLCVQSSTNGQERPQLLQETDLTILTACVALCGLGEGENTVTTVKQIQSVFTN